MSDAVHDAQRRLALLGHPDHRWSIVLLARLAEPLDRDRVRSRIEQALADRPSLGPAPDVGMIGAAEIASTLRSVCEQPYEPTRPALRVTVVGPEDPGVIVGAHHGVLDGIGLLALLAVVLGQTVRTNARGVGPNSPHDQRFVAFAARRVFDALLYRPTRIAGTPPTPSLAGESLAQRELPALQHGTRGLTSAAARGVIAWNRSQRKPADRIAIAIGASQRPSSAPTLEHRAVWMRIRARSGEEHEIERALREALPLSAQSQSDRFAWAGRLASGLLSRRLGSTLLLSNLGVVFGPPELRTVSFYPVTHGRRAVAFGAATVGEITTVTLRAEARDFNSASLHQLLDTFAAELAAARHAA